jgi:hypothetical protein
MSTAPNVKVAEPKGFIHFDVGLALLDNLFKRVSADPASILVTHATLQVVSSLAINLQHEMVRRGLWEKVVCPNCLKEVQLLNTTFGTMGPEIHWKCGTPGCWASADTQKALV